MRTHPQKPSSLNVQLQDTKLKLVNGAGLKSATDLPSHKVCHMGIERGEYLQDTPTCSTCVSVDLISEKHETL